MSDASFTLAASSELDYIPSSLDAKPFDFDEVRDHLTVRLCTCDAAWLSDIDICVIPLGCT
jgi:hypothetical protein